MTHTSAFQKFRRILHQAHCQNLHSEGASLPSQYQRRKFLKLSALAGSAAIATTAIPLIRTAASLAKPPKIAIDEFYGYMNGGAQTGRLAAQVIIENISVAK